MTCAHHNLPCEEGKIVVEGNFSGGDDVVFEPDRSALKELGLSSTGSVLTVQPGGKVLIPFHNHRNSCINVETQVIVGAVLSIEADQITSLVDKDFVKVRRVIMSLWDQTKEMAM